MLLVELQFLPPIPTFIAAVKARGLLIESCETYQKRSFRNRMDIVDAQGVHTISIPLKKGKNENMPIKEVEIAYDEEWQKRMVRKIQTAYGKAAYYPDYSDSLFKLVSTEESKLYDYSMQLLKWIVEIMELPIQITETGQYMKQNSIASGDWRNKNLSFYKTHTSKNQMNYAQIFEYYHGFIPNLSIIDMLFNCGPEAAVLLNRAASE